MLASQAGRRALAATGIALVTIGWPGGSVGALEVPPVTVPEVTVPVDAPVVTVPVDAPVVTVPVDAPVVTVPSLPGPTSSPAGEPSPPTTVAVAPATTGAPVPVPSPAPVPAAAPVAPAPVPGSPVPPEASAPAIAAPALRAVASRRAREFAFPFTLVLAVLGFLVVQHFVARNDPRLVAAPIDDDRRVFR